MPIVSPLLKKPVWMMKRHASVSGGNSVIPFWRVEEASTRLKSIDSLEEETHCPTRCLGIVVLFDININMPVH